MVRIQDIADMAGVSRTTVSNVIRGNTKKVSQETIDKITKILDEQKYVPNMASMSLTGNVSKIIGLVTYYQIHGMHAAQDTFVGELIGSIENEIRRRGYYMMLISAEAHQEIIDVASSWNMDGLIVLGYTEEEYIKLTKKLNKKMVLIDTYPDGEYTFQNVGIDDFDGGYQVGRYLYNCGYKNALFLAEWDMGANRQRWLGFKAAMEDCGTSCPRSRYIQMAIDPKVRLRQYKRWIQTFKAAGALAFSSDYTAIEAMNFFYDLGIKVPDEISVVGFDDNVYATMVRPRLTTVRQNVTEKGKIAADRLIRMINGEVLTEMCITSPVRLIKRESVKDLRK